LGGGERRRPRGRHLAGRLAAAGESVVDVPPELSARVLKCSRVATPARTTNSMPSPPRSVRLAQRTAGSGRSRGRLGGALRPLSERRFRPGGRAYPSVQPPPRAPAEPRSRRGTRYTLDPPSRAYRARHTSTGRRLGPPAPAVGFGDPALRIRTPQRKIADPNGRIEAEVEASGTTLTEIFGVGPILAAKIVGTVGDAVRFPTPRPTTSPPTPVRRRRWRPRAGRWCATGSRWPETASSTTPCTWSPSAKPDRMFGVAPTTARRSRRANLVRRHCGASSGASPMPSSRASWQIYRCLRATPLDKEEPRAQLRTFPRALRAPHGRRARRRVAHHRRVITGYPTEDHQQS